MDFFLSVLVQWEVIVHFYIYTDKSSDFFRDPYPRMCIQMNDSFVHKVACCLPFNVYIFPPYSCKTKCSANNNPLIRDKKNHCMENKCPIILCKEDMGFETTMTKYVRLLRFGFIGIFLPPKYYNYH